MRPLLIALFALLLAAAPAAAEPVPDGYTYEDAWFPSHDGTQLHAGVFLPADRKEGERHPVLMTITPYTSPNGGATAAGNLTGPVIRFPELFEEANILEDRWAYVQVDARGFGGSGGCFEYYGPNEFKDAGVAVEWGASQAWSSGKVGLWGKSYDAAQEVLALAARPKGLAAAVIQAPGLSAYTGLWMNRVHYATGRYGTTGVYTADDVGPPQNLDTIGSPDYAAAWASGLLANPACRADAIVSMNTVRDRDDPFWKDREPYKLAAGSTTPTFWSHGFYDANTKPEHLEIWTQLKGPRQAWFGQYTHLRGHEAGVGRGGFLAESMRFLSRHVLGRDPGATDPPVTVQQGNGDGRWRAEEQWPPADADPWALPLRAGSYADAPGNTAGSGDGLWTITRELPHAAHLAGRADVSLAVDTAAPDVNVVAHLYDIAEDGTARLVNRGAAAVKGSGEQAVAFGLYPQDWVFERGHRIALRLSGSDDDWYSPGVSQTSVEVTGGSLTLPLLRYFHDAYLEGGGSDGMASAGPFEFDLETLRAAVVDAALPAARVARPGPPPAGKPKGKKRRLRARLVGRGAKRRLVVRGRAKTRRVRLLVRLSGVRVARRKVRVRDGRFRAVFSVRRLRSGRLEVVLRAGKASPIRVRLKLRPRR